MLARGLRAILPRHKKHYKPAPRHQFRYEMPFGAVVFVVGLALTFLTHARGSIIIGSVSASGPIGYLLMIAGLLVEVLEYPGPLPALLQ